MAEKTLQQIANEVGSTLRYYNRDTDTWAEGADVTESDIKAMVNYLYLDEVFPRFASQYSKFFYKKTGYFNSWVASGTVDATASGTTLVATTSIFKNSMADHRLYVYNATDDESVTIEGYTSGTTVTVSDSVSDWVGDSIYILGQEFSFGGDGTDHWLTLEVAVKYGASDTVYVPAVKVDQDHMFITGYEEGSEQVPTWYDTSLLVSDVLTTGVGIFPKFDTKISNAIRTVRIAKPTTLGDSDSPRLPVSLPLVNGALAWAKRQQGGSEMGNHREFQGLYEAGIEKALANWRPDRSDFPKTVRMSSRARFRKRVYR